MEKDLVIAILSAMGFELDYDQWDVDGKEWARFGLKNKELRHPDLCVIWRKNDMADRNFSMVSDKLFKAGQKDKVLHLRRLMEI